MRVLPNWSMFWRMTILKNEKRCQQDIIKQDRTSTLQEHWFCPPKTFAIFPFLNESSLNALYLSKLSTQYEWIRPLKNNIIKIELQKIKQNCLRIFCPPFLTSKLSENHRWFPLEGACSISVLTYITSAHPKHLKTSHEYIVKSYHDETLYCTADLLRIDLTS